MRNNLFSAFAFLIILTANVVAELSEPIITESLVPATEPVPAPAVAEPVSISMPIADAITETKQDTIRYAWNKGINYGVGAGVLGGFSVRLGYRFPKSNSFVKNRFGFRLDYNTLGPVWNYFENTINKEGQKQIDDGLDDIDDIEISNANFKADLSSHHFGMLVDFHPFGYIWGLGAFRLTTGYYFGGLNLTAKISDFNIRSLGTETFQTNIELEDNETIPVDVSIKSDLDTKEPLEAEVKFNANGPYVGFGLDSRIIGGLHLTFDVGVVISIKPHRVSIGIPMLEVPDDAEIEVSWSPHPREGELIDQLREEKYCDEPGTPTCESVRQNRRLEVPRALVEQYRQDYGYVIDDFNKEVQENTDEAFSKANKELKKWPYFPMVKFGIMWRF